MTSIHMDTFQRPAPYWLRRAEKCKQAGDLRLAHRDASLDELGHHADPPLTKDAVAGRIRRLLAMADKRATAEGIPGTESAVPSQEPVA